MPDSARITVYGEPAPQGSKSAKGRTGTGRIILTESSAKVKPWREAVKWACIEGGRPYVSGAVTVRMVFTLRKPLSAPKRRTTYPDRYPDLDKCVRSTADALKQAGVIDDDARIVWLNCGKVYPREHPDALDVPGAVIEVSAMSLENKGNR